MDSCEFRGSGPCYIMNKWRFTRIDRDFGYDRLDGEGKEEQGKRRSIDRRPRSKEKKREKQEEQGRREVQEEQEGQEEQEDQAAQSQGCEQETWGARRAGPSSCLTPLSALHVLS